MMSPLSSITPSGTAAARSQAGAGTGDPMASAFAMLFALMPGMGDAAASDGGDGLPKTKGDAAKDGSTTEKGGKDLPSDAAALPVMPFAIPSLPLAPPEPDAKPVAASGTSPAPITTLLAAMPTLPDARPAPTTAPVGLTPAAAPDPTNPPVAFDPLKGTMPVPPAIIVPTADDASPAVPITIRPDAPPAMASLNTGSSVPTTTQPDPAVAPMPTNSTSATTARGIPAAILRNTVPDAHPKTQGGTVPAPIAHDTVASVPISRNPAAPAPVPDQAVRSAVPGVPLAIRADGLPTALPVDGAPIVRTADGVRSASTQQDMPLRFTATSASAPIVASLPIAAPTPILQAGQTASASQLFRLSMRGEQDSNPLTDRRKDEAALSVDATTLTRADSLTAAPVLATTGAEQAPLDMTQAHWPQAMIDRIDRMREDAATADTRIQLSPDALGGIAVNLRHEGGATHIHFTADQAQTATLLADAQPTLARLAEEKGMRLGQTAVDLGQSGAGGERQAPPRRPDPVQPTRPAFAAATPSSDAGDTAAASTRIA